MAAFRDKRDYSPAVIARGLKRLRETQHLWPFTCPVCLRKFRERVECVEHIERVERTKESLVIARPLEELVHE